MKTLMNTIIEMGSLSKEDQSRLKSVDAIIDYFNILSLYSNVNIYSLHKSSVVKKPDDIYYTLTEPKALFCCQDMRCVTEVLATYVSPGHFIKPDSCASYSLTTLIQESIWDLLKTGTAPYYGTDIRHYFILLSQVLAKIVTRNPSAQGVLMMYFHNQFVKLELTPTL